MNENETYIKDIRIYQAVSKLSHPIADSTHDISKIAFYVLEVETKGGVIGQGYLLSFHYSPNAIEGALKDMKNFVLAKDYHVYETAQVQKDYEIESEYFGIVGLQRWALATLNVAMWDAWERKRMQGQDPGASRSTGCSDATENRSRYTEAADGSATRTRNLLMRV